jgi:hypothetical protein
VLLGYPVAESGVLPRAPRHVPESHATHEILIVDGEDAEHEALVHVP